MKESIELALASLSNALKEDTRVQEMKEKENRMMESEEVIHLSHRLEEAERTYGLAVSSTDKSMIEKTKIVLHEAKLALDSHPLVKDYTEAFIIVRDLYMQIDDIIFSPYRKKVISGGSKR